MNSSRRNVFGRRELLAGGAALAVGSMLSSRGQTASPADRPGRTPHTRFAVNIEMWFTALPFLDRIAKAAELGFPAIEFWPWRGREVDVIAERCREHSLEIAQFTAWGFRPGLNHPDNHDRFVEEVAASSEVAHQLSCKLMTVVAGDDQPGMTKAQMHEHVIQGLKRGAKVAEEQGVTLILEPMNGRVDHKGHCLYGSEDAVRIVRAVGSPAVKINWDLYHMQISEGDLCGHLRDGFDALGYVQVADHPGRHEPGTGEVCYTRVFQELLNLGYRGLVGLECVPRDGEPEAARRIHSADSW